MTEPTTHTLAAPGAQLYYELRGAGPLIALVGAPMHSAAFAPLADLLAPDHTVLTLDPRGVQRSRVEDPDADSTPELRAADLAAVIEAVDAGPAVVLGSSGGAVTALALLQSRPDLVARVVAHEPPLTELLHDREQMRADQDAILAAYVQDGPAAAWALFLRDANLDDPGPDAVGTPHADQADPQAAADERHFFLHEMLPTSRWQPDLDALRTAGPRLVVGIGVTSAGQTCDLTSRALASAIGVEPTAFPGGHIGFVEDPPAFAQQLRAALTEAG